MNNYNSLTNTIIEELKSIVGKGNVITDSEKLEAYSHDETDARNTGTTPKR